VILLSALLEVLDEHNVLRHFLEMGYDLSKVMFIATSNTMSSIQPALRDRMEIIKMCLGILLKRK
jgi:ATP-dependent Lon protease